MLKLRVGDIGAPVLTFVISHAWEILESLGILAVVVCCAIEEKSERKEQTANRELDLLQRQVGRGKH